MELLVIPAVLVFYFLFRVFVSVGDHSTPRMHAPRVDKWGNQINQCGQKITSAIVKL